MRRIGVTASMALLLVAAMASPGTTARSGSPRGGDSLYVWHAAIAMVNGMPDAGRSDAEQQQDLLRFCTADGIEVRRLYFRAEPSSSDEESLHAFLAAAADRGIDVYAVPRGTIQNDWIGPLVREDACDHEAVVAWAREIVRFNRRHPEARFAGIQLDIEPHAAIPDGKGRPLWQSGKGGLKRSARNRSIAREYLRMLEQVRATAEPAGLLLAATLPAALDRHDRGTSYRFRYRGRSAPWIHHVIDRVDFVSLMNYVNGSTRISRKAAWREIAGEMKYGPTEVIFQTDRPGRGPLRPSKRTTLFRGGEKLYFRIRGEVRKRYGDHPHFIGCGVHYYRNAYGGGAPGWPER